MNKPKAKSQKPKLGRGALLNYALCIILALSSCSKELLPAEVIIIDPSRHYYPVVQGELMGVNYEIENISDNPLFIQEIQTTCGCIIPRDDLPIVVLPHKKGHLHLEFNTIKNNGYAEHFIYCYGNFKEGNMVELQFDTNVVPRADYFHDYEQLWKDQEKSVEVKRRRDDGTYDPKGYYTGRSADDENPEEASEVPATTVNTSPNNTTNPNSSGQPFRRGR